MSPLPAGGGKGTEKAGPRSGVPPFCALELMDTPDWGWPGVAIQSMGGKEERKTDPGVCPADRGLSLPGLLPVLLLVLSQAPAGSCS